MAARTLFLLGRSVWTRSSGGWQRTSFDQNGGLASPAAAHLSNLLSVPSKNRTVVVYEPAGLAHQMVECPKASRSVFASLARVRSENPVVASEILGWGMEPPETVSSGVSMTLLHSELTPGLVHLRDSCVRAGSRFCSAWSAYTIASECAQSTASPAAVRFVLFLIPGFVAVATCVAGKRAFKIWTETMSERDWKALSALIGDFESRPSGSVPETEPRRCGIIVVAEGDPEVVCPIWDALLKTGRISSVTTMDSLSACAGRIARGHPANLTASFPVSLRLDRYLAIAGMAGLSLAAALGGVTWHERKVLDSEDEMHAERVAALQARVDALRRNRSEMEKLRNEAPERPDSLGLGKEAALTGLAASVPEAVTLTSLEIGKEDDFELEAIVADPAFDPEKALSALGRSGFKSVSRNGWEFDRASGRLRVRGRYMETLP